MNDPRPVSVVVMTYNEELNLERCLESVCPRAGEIIVVDSFSTDCTLEIARRYTDRIYQHPYEGHPQQWQWTLSHVPFGYEWVFAVDADFQVTPALWDAIGEALSHGGPRANGYFVRHRQIFRGRFLRHGTLYPRYWLRLFRRTKVRIDAGDLVDVHFCVEPPVGRLEQDVVEDNRKEHEIAFWIEKQLRFAQRQAVEELRREEGGSPPLARARLFGTPEERTLWRKAVWRRLPRYVRPWLLFAYRYLLRLGFLDGKEGFLYHFTQALVYRTLVDARMEELEARVKAARSAAAKDLGAPADAKGEPSRCGR